jgi:hypothetical protein
LTNIGIPPPPKPAGAYPYDGIGTDKAALIAAAMAEAHDDGNVITPRNRVADDRGDNICGNSNGKIGVVSVVDNGFGASLLSLLVLPSISPMICDNNASAPLLRLFVDVDDVDDVFGAVSLSPRYISIFNSLISQSLYCATMQFFNDDNVE